MKLSAVKEALKQNEKVLFQLPNGKMVPSHFHITEIGKISKHFIDCGGTERTENKISFQLWTAEDFDHRLAPQKLLNIIKLSEDKLNLQDEEIEVEYQGETIGKYGLTFDGRYFQLTALSTDCLAKDQCGIPQQKQKIALADLQTDSCCSPGGGCC